MPSNDTNNTAAIVRRFDELPDDAVVPTEVTAAIHGVSPRTVRRRYPSVQLSPNRKGQRVGTIRAMSRAEKFPS
jgi:ABC-type proline/glycine betaine transport system ATPase subunit